jgi:hypothetical protein
MVTLAEVLKAARSLPQEDRVKLAGMLLSEFITVSPPLEEEPAAEGPLETLSGLSEGELRVLAEAVMAPAHQQRLQAMLRKNREEGLTPAEKEELDKLLKECDQVALLKAKALYTLALLRRGEKAL